MPSECTYCGEEMIPMETFNPFDESGCCYACDDKTLLECLRTQLGVLVDDLPEGRQFLWRIFHSSDRPAIPVLESTAGVISGMDQRLVETSIEELGGAW